MQAHRNVMSPESASMLLHLQLSGRPSLPAIAVLHSPWVGSFPLPACRSLAWRRPCLSLSNYRRHHRHVAMAVAPSSPSREEVVVVGAGPAGWLVAHYLLKRGFSVRVFEKRPSAPVMHLEEGTEEQVYVRGDSRSYTILLTSRAVKALEGAGLQLPPKLLRLLVGSCIHLPSGKKRLLNYSNDPGLQSYGISRTGIVAYLQQSLFDRYPDNLKVYFEWELVAVDDKKNIASFRPTSNSGMHDKQQILEMKYDLLVGADGVNSEVRSELFRLDNLRSRASETQQPLTMKFIRNPDSYKSFHVRSSLAKESPLLVDHNRVQSWPALNMLLVGMADGSFWGGTKNVDMLKASTPEEVETMFRQHAPEVLDLLQKENPDFTKDFLKQPAISFGGALTLSRFHHGNILLIGDAAHAMFPSYGTGCNVALEDCYLLDQILAEVTPSGPGRIPFSEAAAEFTRRRLEDAHAIVDLNTTMELFPRGFVGILQTMLLTTLHKLAPKFFRPTSYQQLWSDVPFRDIKVQKHMENQLFFGLLGMLAMIAIAIIIFAMGIWQH